MSDEDDTHNHMDEILLKQINRGEQNHDFVAEAAGAAPIAHHDIALESQDTAETIDLDSQADADYDMYPPLPLAALYSNEDIGYDVYVSSKLLSQI